jgi:hypothetical protein
MNITKTTDFGIVFRPVPDAANGIILGRLAAEADDLVFLEDRARERAFANYSRSATNWYDYDWDADDMYYDWWRFE